MVKGAIDVDIGANPSDEGGEEDESVDDSVVKVIDIVDTFRLQVKHPLYCLLVFLSQKCIWICVNGDLLAMPCFWQGQTSFNKKQFVTYMKHYIKLLMPKLEAEKQELFKKHIEQATKILLSMLSDLQL